MLKLVVLACLALLARGALVVPPVGTISDKRHIPVAPPMNRELRDSCIHKCLNVAPSLAGNLDTGLPCIADCIESVVASIREWATKLPSRETMPVPANREVMTALYQDGVVLQNKLMALRRIVEKPGGVLWNFFPNLPKPNFGLGFQPPQHQGFTANTPTIRFPGLLAQIIQRIATLLTQVINNQQELLQTIVGCTSTNSTTVAPPVTTPSVTTPSVTTPLVTTPTTTTPTTTTAPPVAE